MVDQLPLPAPAGPTDPFGVVVHEVAPDHPEVHASVAAYVAELGARFPHGFDPGPPDLDGVFLLATSTGADGTSTTLACGGVRDLGGATGEIKRMWVHRDARGTGLGTRMLAEFEHLCTRLGHTRVRLDTNGTLVEAIALYERAGYRRIARYNDNPYAEAWFEKEL